jgi:hypothetical protein
MRPEEAEKLSTWIEANVPYYATYEHTRPGTPGSRCHIQSDFPPGTQLVVRIYRTYLDKDGNPSCWESSASLFCLLSEQASHHAGAFLELPIDDLDRSALPLEEGTCGCLTRLPGSLSFSIDSICWPP